MEIELLPAVSLLPETLSVLVAPEEMLARALNGIRSGVLSRLDRSSMELDVRRAFTSVQLRTILEENYHPFLIVEHRSYERARDMAGHVAQAMKQASRGHPPVRPGIGPAPGSHGRVCLPGLLLL